MRLAMFSVYDDKAAAYMPPFFERAEGAAVRAFMSACNDEKHNFFKSSADYSLYILGVFDDATGALVSTSPPRVLARASDMKSTGI